jgi:hypothetical protein
MATTDIKNACAGDWPGHWTANLASVVPAKAKADWYIDSITAPDAISLTSDAAKSIAIDVGLRIMQRGDRLRESSAASSSDGNVYPEIVILTDEIKERIWAAMKTTSSGLLTLKLMED